MRARRTLCVTPPTHAYFFFFFACFFLHSREAKKLPLPVDLTFLPYRYLLVPKTPLLDPDIVDHWRGDVQ